jgi:hypothetical protein
MLHIRALRNRRIRAENERNVVAKRARMVQETGLPEEVILRYY